MLRLIKHPLRLKSSTTSFPAYSSISVSLPPRTSHALTNTLKHDADDPTTPQAFFPLTSAKAEKLAKRFNDTVYNAKLLAALPKGEDIDSKPYVAPVEEVEEVAAVGEDGVKVEESISTEGVQKGGAVL